MMSIETAREILDNGPQVSNEEFFSLEPRSAEYQATMALRDEALAVVSAEVDRQDAAELAACYTAAGRYDGRW